MNNYNFNTQFLNLISRYPSDISCIFKSIFESLLSIVPDEDLYSVLLIGSSSRNELSYSNKDTLDLFSDIEFLIITKKPLLQDKISSIDYAMKSLEKSINSRSPLFHIDYGISTINKFRLTPATLFSYEVKNLGVLVYGEDARNDLKKITLSNLDFGNLNELIIVRLWNMFINVNNNYLNNNANSYEKFIVQFFYSRNILDILTILLPNKGVLIGGYRNRLNFFIREFDDNKWNDYKDGFGAATNLKLDLEVKISIEEAQGLFLSGYINLISDLSGIDNVYNLDDLEKKFSDIVRSNIFKENLVRTLRRKYIEFTLFIKYYKSSLSSIKFFFNDKIRFNLLFSILYIHKSIISKKTEDLIKSIKYFNNINTKNKIYYNENLTYFENLDLFRNQLIDFMMIWFYSRTITTRKELNKHIQWKDKKRYY